MSQDTPDQKGTPNDKEEALVREIYDAANKGDADSLKVPANIDRAILSAAKAKSTKQKHKHKTARSNRLTQWQYSGSLAACILLVGIFVLMDDVPNIENQTIPAIEQGDGAEAFSAPKLMSEEPSARSAEVATEALEQEKQRVQVQNEQAQRRRISDSARSVSELSIDPQVAREMAVDDLVLEDLALEDMASTIDTQALTARAENLFERLKQTQAEGNSVAQTPLQREFFETLLLLQAADSTWEIAPEYNEVLSEEQQSELGGDLPR